MENHGVAVCYISNELFNDISEQRPYLHFDENKQYTIADDNKEDFERIYNSDRSLYFYYSKARAISLMQYWFEKSLQFIKKQKIKYSIIEGTPAHELVFELACKKSRVCIINIFHAPGPRGWSLISDTSVEKNLFKNFGRRTDYFSQAKKLQEARKVYADVSEKFLKNI